MYRNKSSVSLRTLANSLKHSINVDRQKAQAKEFIPLRNSASSINLIGANSEMKTIVNNTNYKGNRVDNQYLIMLQTRKTNKIAATNHMRQQQQQPQPYNRDSNCSEVKYDIKGATDLLNQRKQRLLEMTKTNSLKKFLLSSQSNTANPQPQRTKNAEITCMLNVLMQQQSHLKEVIQQKYSSNTLKSCNKHIIEAQIVCAELKEITSKYNQFIEHKSQLQNRLMFLQEEVLSTKMNFNEQISQKDQCQQFLLTYRENSQYQEQAQYVMRLIRLQYEIESVIEIKKYQLQNQLIQLQSDYTNWKLSENIEFKQNKFHNKLKELRLRLMKAQTDVDSISVQLSHKYQAEGLSKNTIKKIREYIFSFFKIKCQFSVNTISYGEVEQGMDFFLCKNGKVKQFTKFVTQSTSKICTSHENFALKLNQYLDCLKKIQQLYHTHNTEVNKAITDKFQDKIYLMKKQIQNLNDHRRKNLSQIDTIFYTIQKLLSEDSLTIIQLTSKKTSSAQTQFNKQDGLYNLCQIKSKVKQSKNDQQKRIIKAKQNFIRIKQLEVRLSVYAEENPKNQLKWAHESQTLQKEIKLLAQKIQQIEIIKHGYESKKLKLENFIDETITKIREKDLTQEKLTSIQKEIQILKKQKIEEITKKHLNRKTNQQLAHTENNIKSKLRPFSSVNNLQQYTQKVFKSKITSNVPEPFFEIGSLKLTTQIRQTTQHNSDKSAEFRIIREEPYANQKIHLDEQKMSTKTQSSPKNPQGRLSLGALNSILLSKCNLGHSKNLLENQFKSIVRSGSLYGGIKKLNNKENELNKDQLLLESRPHSRKSSNVMKKESTSRKNSILKNNLHKSTARNPPSDFSTGGKLSLSTNTRKPSFSKPSSQSKQSPYVKSKQQKDLNSLITNKLLRK